MVEKFLEEHLAKKKWPFLYVVQVYAAMKDIQERETTRAELNELFKAGKIRKREGVNGDLIEIIDNSKNQTSCQ